MRLCRAEGLCFRLGTSTLREKSIESFTVELPLVKTTASSRISVKLNPSNWSPSLRRMGPFSLGLDLEPVPGEPAGSCRTAYRLPPRMAVPRRIIRCNRCVLPDVAMAPSGFPVPLSGAKRFLSMMFLVRTAGNCGGSLLDFLMTEESFLVPALPGVGGSSCQRWKMLVTTNRIASRRKRLSSEERLRIVHSSTGQRRLNVLLKAPQVNLEGCFMNMVNSKAML